MEKDMKGILKSVLNKINSKDTFTRFIGMKLIELKVGCMGRKADPIGNFYFPKSNGRKEELKSMIHC